MPQGKHADAPLNYGSKIIQGSSRLWSIHLFIYSFYLFIYFAPQISRLRLQYEEKMKGLMPASLREVKFYCLCLLMGNLPSRVFPHRKLLSFSLRDIPLHATCSDGPNWGPKGQKKKFETGAPLISGSDALILFQILPTYSVRKCTQILQTDLYTDTEA